MHGFDQCRVHLRVGRRDVGRRCPQCSVDVLGIDARRWFASKLHPGAHGDRLEVNGKLLDVTQLHMQMLRELAQRPVERAIEGESFRDADRALKNEAAPVDKGEDSSV